MTDEPNDLWAARVAAEAAFAIVAAEKIVGTQALVDRLGQPDIAQLITDLQALQPDVYDRSSRVVSNILASLSTAQTFAAGDVVFLQAAIDRAPPKG